MASSQGPLNSCCIGASQDGTRVSLPVERRPAGTEELCCRAGRAEGEALRTLRISNLDTFIASPPPPLHFQDLPTRAKFLNMFSSPAYRELFPLWLYLQLTVTEYSPDHLSSSLFSART